MAINSTRDDKGNQGYFAAEPPTRAASTILNKVDTWSNNLEANGYLDKLRMSWSAYHGAYYTDASSGHQIAFSGSEGEITNLPVNHLRNLAQHILVMTCSTRPAMDVRAINTDYKSLTQAYLAKGLLDYYMREKRLEVYIKRAVEYAIVLGAGYIKMSWNATSGQEVEFDEDLQVPVYEGDVEFQNLSPFDVVMDNTKEDSSNHSWYVVRTWKNKYDVAAKYPEFKDKIMAVPTKIEALRYRFNMISTDETDDIAIYEFFHKRTESLPNGRYLLFVSDDCVLIDSPLPYRDLPIFRISPADFLGTPYGYASVFDLLPLQEAVNALYSTILTNQNAFGVQNILVPRGADISISELTGGLNIIEANIQNGKPEALNLTQTPAEIFKFSDMLVQAMETISGVNSVARGNPEASLKSGTALALIQSMSIQFMSGLQQSYVEMIEDVGTALIHMLQDFAAAPRVAAIAGISKRTEMKSFKGEDLSEVHRVVVDIGNPLSRTTAGRVQMAEQLLQMGAIKNPDQYFSVINTGQLDTMMEGTQSEMLLIRGENEAMLHGEQVPVLNIDEHKQHIIEHRSILADPELRKNPLLVKTVLGHIQEHIQALQNTDPQLLQMLGQQPMQAPPPPGQPQQGPGPMGSPSGAPTPPPQLPPQAAPSGEPQPQPPMPNLPKVPANVLPNPAAQQQAMGNVKGA